jgi:hemophore
MTTTAWTVSRSTMRRGLYWVFAAGALGGVAAAVLALPSAAAATDPCAASEIARTIGTVATNAGSYLDSHPATNTALTSAARQDPQQALGTLKTYFDANPQVGRDMSTLQQPLQSLSTQCKLPISGPQVLQLLQGMQQGGGLPGGLTVPGGTTSPLGANTPAAATPAGPAGSGPPPGPLPATTR